MRDLTTAPLTDAELEDLTTSALQTLLWTSSEAMDENDEFLYMWDQKFSAQDATDEARARIKSDLTKFVTANVEDLTLYINHPAILEHVAKYGGEPLGQIAHDWILSRGGHGTGFWDRGTATIGERLHDACKHQELYVFAGEDAVEPLNTEWAGKFHVEG